MASLRSNSSIPLLALAAFLIIGGLIGLQRKREQAPTSGAGLPGSCEATGDCGPEDPNAAPRVDPRDLTSTEACGSAGYLCVPLEHYDVIQVQRWPEDTERLIVHVPPHPVTGSERVARELRDAAIRGIRAWDGHPFPIVIDRTGDQDADFSVRWTFHLSGANTDPRRHRLRKERGLRFDYMEVAYMHTGPDGRERMRTPEQLEAGAVREMGHALGLAWSDRVSDVMHPDNTSARISTRDHQTLAALYALPNGTFIRR